MGIPIPNQSSHSPRAAVVAIVVVGAVLLVLGGPTVYFLSQSWRPNIRLVGDGPDWLDDAVGEAARAAGSAAGRLPGHQLPQHERQDAAVVQVPKLGFVVDARPRAK